LGLIPIKDTGLRHFVKHFFCVFWEFLQPQLLVTSGVTSLMPVPRRRRERVVNAASAAPVSTIDAVQNPSALSPGSCQIVCAETTRRCPRAMKPGSRTASSLLGCEAENKR
jgi:hypothetical protein